MIQTLDTTEEVNELEDGLDDSKLLLELYQIESELENILIENKYGKVLQNETQ